MAAALKNRGLALPNAFCKSDRWEDNRANDLHQPI
jgi:hypothetical protein